jgi:pyruvate/2-oxoglutarate dehydrogenase complex dihydrolipoamide acyltransferase (E2) component
VLGVGSWGVDWQPRNGNWQLTAISLNPTEFKIPELGENVSAGDVVRVLVKAGDTIEKDQPVLELETDKATIEVPSSVSGSDPREVKVKPGDKVKVGQVVLTLGRWRRG